MAPQPKRQGTRSYKHGLQVADPVSVFTAKATMPAPKRTKLDPRQLKLTRFFTSDLLTSPSVPATSPFISTASLPDNENGRTTSANTEDITSDSRVVEEHTRTTDGRHELIPAKRMAQSRTHHVMSSMSHIWMHQILRHT
jgi:hypothetical protein